MSSEGAAIFAATVEEILLRGRETPKTIIATHYFNIFLNGILLRGIKSKDSHRVPFTPAHMEVMLPPRRHVNQEGMTFSSEGNDEVVYLFKCVRSGGYEFQGRRATLLTRIAVSAARTESHKESRACLTQQNAQGTWAFHPTSWPAQRTQLACYTRANRPASHGKSMTTQKTSRLSMHRSCEVIPIGPARITGGLRATMMVPRTWRQKCKMSWARCRGMCQCPTTCLHLSVWRAS